MKNVSLRLAASADEAFLFRLYETTRAEEMQLTGWNNTQIDAFLKTQYAIREKQYEARYPDARNWIIEIEKQSVGRHLIQQVQPMWIFVDLAILPKYQNRGIGTFVLKTHMKQALAVGAGISLSVKADNRTRNLYKRLGFVVTAKTDIYLQMEYQPNTSRL